MINEEAARKFAEDSFSKLAELDCKWNITHVKCMIRAIKQLTKKESIINRLVPLAWIHDIGKIKREKDHAKLSVEILEKNKFNLDNIDKDCVLNHGSNGKPESEEAKIFRVADGISLFYPELLLLRFYAEAKEGESFDEIIQNLQKVYEKYSLAYKNIPKAVELLKQKYEQLY